MKDILKIFKLIKRQSAAFQVPWVTQEANGKNGPYRVLISCILSLRTKDKTTALASLRLFKIADDPRKMIRLNLRFIKRLIYPVGFYRNKSQVILDISRRLIADFKGRVPDTEVGLLSLRGVGRKTANLVLGLGYGIPAICVDTHVHRISNRLGWISTETVQESEQALQRIIPKGRWIDLNTVLVTFGQNLCFPVSPYCSKCCVCQYCMRAGVVKHR